MAILMVDRMPPRRSMGLTTRAKLPWTAYNQCVFAGDINGSDVCAGTNGLNREEFEGDTTQLNVSYQLTDNVELKYVFGLTKSCTVEPLMMIILPVNSTIGSSMSIMRRVTSRMN